MPGAVSLTEDQQQAACVLMANGIPLKKICKLLHTNNDTISRTADSVKAFGNEWRKARDRTCNLVENYLLQKAMGKETVVITEKFKRSYDSNGIPLDNADGTPKMILDGMLRQRLPGDNTCILAFLRAHHEDYKNEMAIKITDGSEELRDPQQFKDLLMEKAKKHFYDKNRDKKQYDTKADAKKLRQDFINQN